MRDEHSNGCVIVQKMDTWNRNLLDTMRSLKYIKHFQTETCLDSNVPNFGGRACSETLVRSGIACFIAARAVIVKLYIAA